MGRIIACIVLWVALVGVCTAGTGGILVIVHPKVPVARISRDELRAIYLMRVTFWPGGTPIVPVNCDAESVLRIRFSRRVLGAPPTAFAGYWAHLHFQGENPPLVFGSDRNVAAFVARVPGAIGYVRAGTPLHGVRIVGQLP
ncbi:MAG: hypothetical protein ACYDHM_16025 [Acidiferrobacterales bacterium]